MKKRRVCALVALILVFGVFLAACGSPEETTSGYYDLTIDENVTYGELEGLTEEEIQEALNAAVEEGMLYMSIEPYIKFENGKSEGNLKIINEIKNQYSQVIEIYTEDGDCIYKSGVIPVGGRIDYDTLDKNLKKGIYNCDAHFTAVNDETGAPLARGIIEIIIDVQN